VFYTYLMAAVRNGTLYAGSTEDLMNRVQEHREKSFSGSTARHDVDKLVWFEMHPSREEAFKRERQIKEWRRLWKLQLIERDNPNWIDLFPGLERWLMDEEVRSEWGVLPWPRLSPG
jgi:putative endonuclease